MFRRSQDASVHVDNLLFTSDLKDDVIMAVENEVRSSVGCCSVHFQFLSSLFCRSPAGKANSQVVRALAFKLRGVTVSYLCSAANFFRQEGFVGAGDVLH